MRYIGSKTNIIGFLDEVIHSCTKYKEKRVFGDLFSGTTIVGQFFKKKGYKVISNDYMAFSYILQKAFIKNNSIPKFSRLKLGGYKNVLEHLNHLKGENGFFYKNYCHEVVAEGKYRRNYFSVDNSRKIDVILTQLREWNATNNISESEDAILRASLIESVTKVSNISGTYGSFLKHDDPRKHKKIFLEPIKVIKSRLKHDCFNEDILTLIDNMSGDILYLDPPYNQRQYPPYYHILETISLDDNPEIYGKTGRRPYKDKLSPFCVKNEAKTVLCDVIRRAKFKDVFLSYNTEGLVSIHDLENSFKRIGEVKVFYHDYRRYRSNGNGKTHRNVKEVLFYVKK